MQMLVKHGLSQTCLYRNFRNNQLVIRLLFSQYTKVYKQPFDIGFCRVGACPRRMRTVEGDGSYNAESIRRRGLRLGGRNDVALLNQISSS